MLCSTSGSSRTKLIFLDIDGVIIPWDVYCEESTEDKPNGEVSKKAMDRLDKLIDETDAKIVISSSWGNTKSVDRLREVLKDFGLRHYTSVIDKVKTDFELDSKDRGEKILDYLVSNNMVNSDGSYTVDFVILDDEFEMYGLESHFVKCKMEYGFSESDLHRVYSIIGEK